MLANFLIMLMRAHGVSGAEPQPTGTASHTDGLVYKFTPHPTGPWSQTVLHGFSGVKGDGKNPEAGLIFDSAGNLYGTTANGGTGAGGTVFEIIP